jgi:hypothetical protein
MNDMFVGQLAPVVFDYAPPGWLLCDGQTLPIMQYQALYAVIDNRFGGDGVQNFALPDLRGRFPIGAGSGPGLNDYRIGQMGGMTVDSTPETAGFVGLNWIICFEGEFPVRA